MGMFDFFKKKQEEKKNMTYAQMLNGYSPIFSQFGDDIYSSDVVNQALYTIVTEVKKLNPKHIRKQGFDVVPVDDEIQKVLDEPNFLMSSSDFIEKITWQLLLNYNSFIYKEYNGDKLIGLYPLSPNQVTFLETPDGKLFVKLYFKNGTDYILPYSSLIHIKTHYSINDYMGGDSNGQPNNLPLLDTLKLNDVLLQGVKKALQSSFAINGIVKYNTMLDDGSVEQAIKDFEEKLKNSTSGILGIDNKTDVVQFKRDLQIVDEATLKFIDDKILRNFGVPLCMVQGDFTTEQYEAFYQKTIEPLVITISQAFTKSIFSTREKEGFKNKIVFYPKELVFMNTSQTLQMVALLGQSGTLYENEKRVAFGYEPLPELVGVRLQSLNYVNVEYAAQYQTGNNANNQNTNTGIGNEETQNENNGGEDDE